MGTCTMANGIFDDVLIGVQKAGNRPPGDCVGNADRGYIVIPAKAGIQRVDMKIFRLDSCLRRNDTISVRSTARCRPAVGNLPPTIINP